MHGSARYLRGRCSQRHRCPPYSQQKLLRRKPMQRFWLLHRRAQQVEAVITGYRPHVGTDGHMAFVTAQVPYLVLERQAPPLHRSPVQVTMTTTMTMSAWFAIEVVVTRGGLGHHQRTPPPSSATRMRRCRFVQLVEEERPLSTRRCRIHQRRLTERSRVKGMPRPLPRGLKRDQCCQPQHRALIAAVAAAIVFRQQQCQRHQQR